MFRLRLSVREPPIDVDVLINLLDLSDILSRGNLWDGAIYLRAVC